MKKSISMSTIAIVLMLSMACSESSERTIANMPAEAEHNHADHGEMGDGNTMAGDAVSSMNGTFMAMIHWPEALQSATYTNTAHLMFTDADGESVDVELVEFKPFMQAMGHGSDETQITISPAAASADFTIEGVNFSMPGAAGSWVIQVKAVLEGSEDMVMIPVAQVK